MSNLPGRASDAGPQGKAECPACGARNWHTMADCQVCADTVCSRCASAEAEGLICTKCMPEYKAAQDESQCNAIAQLHVIDARVQYANIPEWNTGKVN